MPTEREKLENLIDRYARRVYSYMIDNGFVRMGDNQTPITITVEELAEALDFPETMWDAIKDRMLSLAYAITYGTGRGHYIGTRGEVVMNVIHNMHQIQGRLKRMRKHLIIFGETHTLEEGELWARQNGHGSLGEIAKSLKRNEYALPADLHTYLLEAESKAVGLQ